GLWTLHGLGVLDGANAEATAVACAALKHKSAGVRRNAVQVLPRTPASVIALLESGVLQDPEPLVRLAALLALTDLPAAPGAGKAAVAAVNQPENRSDRWIPDAATSAAANNSEHFLKALGARQTPSPKLLAVTEIVAQHYARLGPADSIGGVLARLADA